MISGTFPLIRVVILAEGLDIPEHFLTATEKTGTLLHIHRTNSR